MNTSQLFAQWLATHREISAVESAITHLRVDRKVGRMPAANGDVRAHDGKVLKKIHHGMVTASAYVDLTGQLAAATDLTSEQAACIHHTQHEIERTLKVPMSLAAEIEEARTKSEAAWEVAKSQGKFALVQVPFAELVRLKREQARCLATDGDLYAALLDHYVPGVSTKWMLEMVEGLVAGLKPLIEKTRGKELMLPIRILQCAYDRADMFQLQQNLAYRMGFDPDRGGFMHAAPPFSIGYTPYNVQLAMSREPRGMFDEIYNMLHEGGHGLANQGYPQDWWYTAMNMGPSHFATEGEAKFWETGIGRSKEFWKFFFPIMQERFPALMHNKYTWWDAYRAVNRVTPSFIRVDADPITYHSHILLRLRTDIGLITGDLPVEEMPNFWNNQSQELLGITPKNDAEGCVQDDHQYDGCFGYFPAYSGADIVGIQWMGAAGRDIAFNEYYSCGQLPPLKDWLTENVFRYGRIHTTEELVRMATGGPISFEPFVALMTERINEVYEL